MLEPWALRNAKLKKRIAALLYENEHLRRAACLRALSKAEAESIRAYGMRNPICVIPNGVDLPELDDTPSAVVSAVLSGWRDMLNELVRWGQRTLSHWASNICSRPKNPALPRQTSPKEERGKFDSGVERLSALEERLLGPRHRWMGSGRIRKRTQAYRSFPIGHFPRAAIRCGKERMLSRMRRIHPAFAERRPADDGARSMGPCKTGVMTPECNLPDGFSAEAALRIETSPEAIADGLRKIIEMSDNDRIAMGARGRDLVSKNFSWPQIGEQMRAVYEWVLGGGAPPETVSL